MLIVAIVVVALIGTISLASESAFVAFTQARMASVAEGQAARALIDAEQTLRTFIAAQVAAGNVDGPFPVIAPSSAAPVCPPNAVGCGTGASIDFTYAGLTSTGSGGPQAAYALQRADAIRENRLAVRMHVVVTDAGGRSIVEKSRDVVVRTFAAAPYAIVTATSDASAQTLGDSAGCDGTNVCAPTASNAADDTRLHALAQCFDNPKTPGMCAGKAIGPNDTTAATSTTQSWTNATNAADGWAR
jgi:hypothetical protein